MDSLNQTSVTIKPKLKKLEEVLSFIRDFTVPSPIFSPIPLCKLSMSDYVTLFGESDGRCGAKLYFKSGILYLVDTLSYLHGKLLSILLKSLVSNNLSLNNYFDYSSYSKEKLYLTFSHMLL